MTFDEWVEIYKEDYLSVGSYDIYNIKKKDFAKVLNKEIDLISYSDIYNLNKKEVLFLINNL